MFFRKNIVLCGFVLVISSGNSYPSVAFLNKNREAKKEIAKIDSADRNTSSFREVRALHEITLSDPLNCLSRIVCGLHTFPPKTPSLRTSTTNDYAYLLKTVISRINRYNQKDDDLFDDLKAKTVEDDTTKEADEAAEEDDEEDYSDEEENDAKVGRSVRKTKKWSTKTRQGRRYSERSGDPSIIGSEKVEGGPTMNYGIRNSVFEQLRPNVDLGKLELLRVSVDVGEKLSSPQEAQCGVLGNICPFRYDEMMKLIAGILRRQTIVSPSGDKIIPLAGYLLKSRNQTTTLTATFSAIERINNLTYAADDAGSPITFNHIYDEILNGMAVGGNGIRILEDSNESASATVWEDDEFDQVLNSPYVEKKLVKNYNVKKTKEQKPVKPVVEEESSEEEDPFIVDFIDEEEESKEESDLPIKGTLSEFNSLQSGSKKKNVPPPPPAFGTIID